MKVMRKNLAKKCVVTQIGKTASILSTVLVLAVLVGCQGLSESSSGGSQQFGNLVLGSASLDFGDVAPNTTKTLTVAATNSGNAAINISSASISTKYFVITSPSFPVSIAAGQSANLSISFTPNAAAKFTATLSITSDASNGAQALALSGAGTGLLALNPTSSAFGSVTVGANKSQVVTITNGDSSSVSISQVSVNSSAFSVTGITTPISLSPSQTTTFTVTFAPKASGNAAGTVTINSDATNPSLTMAVSGTGVTAGALSPNPTSLSFGSVTLGNQSSLSETITNTGASSVTVSQVGLTGTGFSVSGIATPLTLNGGQSATFTVSFVPSAAGAVSGNLTITSTATNSTLAIPISGTGVTPGALASNPTSLSFGNVNVGSKGTLSETITNTGGSSISVTQVGITGTGFSVTGITTPLTLNGGQSATFSVSFAPTAAGAASGNLTVTSTATNPTLTIPVSGTGVTATAGQLTVSPGTLPLGSVTVGSSGSASGTLTASGASVTVTAASTNNSVFTIGGFSLPHTIAAGQSASFTITFSPTVAGAASATLTFTSNAQPTTTTEALTGTGVAAATHSVALSWNASTSQNISGYNIYRALYSTSCGSFAKINNLLNTSTLYTDTSVTNGNTYCYATTAVDSGNAESGYSNIVSNVQIPAQ
ncbi:MAG: hypothetical protein C5B58_04500 [Acidobacteria bacterium]|nr:MAG: hypothetical protein C5B58_04500 [Acidobacteriota bacterium]